jgi:MinD superfamily P-loop ATPase
MKQITVISGKGGTGKTSLVGGFATLAKKAVISDCDVDAPNLHLLLTPQIHETRLFFGLDMPAIDYERCTHCGRCYESCAFNAISEGIEINPFLCEGCGVCAYVCPVDAITLQKKEAGKVYISETRFGPMVHARLGIGEEASGKLVTMVRNTAKEVAETTERELILIDGSPGIGCPVIASLTGTDLAVIVTEPTLSGFHDLERVSDVTAHFGIKAVVCINKYDIHRGITATIEKFCSEHGIEVVGKIPYDPAFTKAMMKEKTIIEYDPSSPVEDIWRRVRESIGIQK